jgi:hypothetical protein
MVLPLKRTINRALRVGVRSVLIADPGRGPFLELCEYYSETGTGKTLERSVSRPKKARAQILQIGEL